MVTGLRLAASRSALPAHPTMVAVNLGDGPQVRDVRATGDAPGQPQAVSLRPRMTDTVTLSLLDWQDVIDRNALGFDQLKPPGLADVAVLGIGWAPTPFFSPVARPEGETDAERAARSTMLIP